VVALVRDGHALIEEATRSKPDVIVTDVFMPLLNGIDAARQLKSRGIDSKIVFLTVQADPKIAAEAFRAGASGFVSKESAGEELIQAIQEAVQGGAYIASLVAKDMIDILVDAKTSPPGMDPSLTSRQREVLQLIAEGRTMKEIGKCLGHFCANGGNSQVRNDGSPGCPDDGGADPLGNPPQTGFNYMN
jgi:DNA-binding NarL/FixJ family response regulator